MLPSSMSYWLVVPVINLSYLVVIFIVWHLWRVSARLLLSLIFATTVAICLFDISQGRHSLAHLGALAKLVCVWPLGLGSLVAFSRLSALARQEHLAFFTKYINAAVLGNIAMMFFLDVGETTRGMFHRLNCVLLVVWLVQEMRQRRWATVAVDHRGFFLFNASPMAWVLSHAAYRLAMVTLPQFDTLRYLVLEPVSLATMVLLGTRGLGKAKTWHDVTLWFGLADTLVVATIVFVSSLWTSLGVTVPILVQGDGVEFERVLDVGATTVHLVVTTSALYHIVWNSLYHARQ